MSGLRIPADLQRVVRKRTKIVVSTANLRKIGKRQSSTSIMFNLVVQAVRLRQAIWHWHVSAVRCARPLVRKLMILCQIGESESSIRALTLGVNTFPGPMIGESSDRRRWAATVAALKMNSPRMVKMRQLLAAANMFPASDKAKD